MLNVSAYLSHNFLFRRFSVKIHWLRNEEGMLLEKRPLRYKSNLTSKILYEILNTDCHTFQGKELGVMAK